MQNKGLEMEVFPTQALQQVGMSSERGRRGRWSLKALEDPTDSATFR